MVVCTDVGDAAREVAEYLSGFSYLWSTERGLQDGIWEVLERSGFAVQRELALTRRDRPDFTVEVGGFRVVVEVKIAGPLNTVLRQLGRYAEHPDVKGIVLASGKRTLLAGVPPLLHGKPIALALTAGRL